MNKVLETTRPVGVVLDVDQIRQPLDNRPTRARYGVLAFLASLLCLAYVSRILSAAGTTIQGEFGLNDAQLGYTLAGFALGYFWFQVPGGIACNRFGARVMFPAMALLWSLAMLWTVTAHSEPTLRWSRVAVGLAQAGLIPCCSKVLADWFPAHRRGLASSVLSCSMQLGAILASGLTASLLPIMSWRTVHISYAALSMLWAVGFYSWFRDAPEEHRRVNAAETALIREGTSEVSTGHDKRVWMAMLISADMWLLCLQSIFRAFGYDFFITWFPAYLEKGYSAGAVSAGRLTMLPLLTMGLGSAVGGYLVDEILERTGSKRISRSGTAASALTLAAVCTLAASFAKSPTEVTTAVSVGSFFLGVVGPANWSALLDMGGSQTAVIAGITNMTGNIGSLLCPIVLGYLFTYIHGSLSNWNLVLYLFAAVNLGGALCWLLLNPNRPLVATAGPA